MNVLRLSAAALLACTGTLHPSPAHAQQPTCHAEAYEQYADAQRAYQHEVARLILAEAPELREMVELARDHQLSLIDAREYALLHTLRENPAALRLDKSVNQWLDWSPDERTRLAAADPAYARLVAKSDSLRKQTSGDPRWTAVREAHAGIAEGPEHRAAVDRLIAAAESAGARCRQ